MVVDAERGFNLGSILTITFLGHMMVHTYMLTFPMIMTFLVEEFGASYVILGIIYTLSNLAFGFGAIGAGYLADRVGSKRLIALSAGGMGFSALLAGLTVNLETLTLSLFLMGAFASLYHPASFTLISKAARERGKAFGIHGIGGSVGLALAPLIAVPVAMEWGWRASFLALALPGVLLALFTLSASLGERLAPVPSPRGTMRSMLSPALLLALMIYACYGLAYRGVIGFLPSFLTAAGGLVVGGIFGNTITLAFGAPGQAAGGLLTDRMGSKSFLIIVFSLLSVSLIMMALSPSLLAFLFAFAAGFLLFASQPATGTLLAESSPLNVRGAAYGLGFMANFGVGAFGASIAGLVADRLSLEMVFPFMTIFLVLGVILLIFRRKVVPESRGE